MLKSAKEVWEAQQNHKDFDDACESVMRAIEKASAEGKRDCLFYPHPSGMDDSVKSAFTKLGYKFKPYGMCGGVWQDAERICW